MRNILTTTKSGLSALAAVGRRTCLAAMLASTLSAASVEFATAQSPYTAAPSSRSLGDNSEASYGLVSGTPIEETEMLVTGSGRQQARSVPAKLASMPSVVGASEYYDGGMVSGGNACCTPGCDVSWYFGYEALWLRREGDENFSLSQFYRLPESDYELGKYGGRITAGRLLDCTNGVEAIFIGPYEWQRGSNVTGNANIDSNFFPAGGLTAAMIDTFNDADQHVQTYQSQFSSFEFNRTWWTWDVLQTLVGLRYIDHEEDYALSTAKVGVGNGLFQSSVNNSAIGPQIGAQLIRPASLRANYGFKGKGALLANFGEVNTIMSNAGSLVLNSNDNAVDWGALIEIGVFANYQIVPSVRLTAGYDFMYLMNFATVPSQNYTNLTPSSGTSIQQEDGFLLHGGSVGVQILY